MTRKRRKRHEPDPEPAARVAPASPSVARWRPALLGLAGLLAFTEAALWLAPLARGPLTFDVGPATPAYLAGFSQSFEYRPVTARFTGRQSAIEVPLETRGGPAQLLVRRARLHPGAITTVVAFSGTAAGRFETAPADSLFEPWMASERRGTPFGEFTTERQAVEVPPGRLRLGLVVEGPDSTGRGVGLAVDWIRIEGLGWRLPARLFHVRLLVAGAFLLLLASGATPAFAVTAGACLVAAVVAWAWLDPFGLAHVAARVTIPCLALSSVAALLLRREAGRHLVVAVFLAGYLLKGAGVLHPSYHYPDVLTHYRMHVAVKDARGSLAEQGEAASGSGSLRRPLAGRMFKFPYSPLFYLPFQGLARRVEVEEAMKLVAVSAAAMEALAVFWLARVVSGPGVARRAALLSACLPPLYSRLTLAMWPAIVGHLFDTLAIASAAWFVVRPCGRRLALFACLGLAACLVYVTGPVNLGLFAAALAMLVPGQRLRLSIVFGLVLGLTAALLYVPFLVRFVTEMLPAIASAGVSTPAGGLSAAASRIPLFFGYAYPLFALAGLALLRRATPIGFRVLAAYGLAFLAEVALRGFPSGVPKELKEIEFVAPLIAVATAVCLAALAARGHRERLAAAAAAVLLAAHGLSKYRGYLSENTGLEGLERLW